MQLNRFSYNDNTINNQLCPLDMRYNPPLEHYWSNHRLSIAHEVHAKPHIQVLEPWQSFPLLFAGVLYHFSGWNRKYANYLGSVQPYKHCPEFYCNCHHWLVRRVHLRCTTKRDGQAIGWIEHFWKFFNYSPYNLRQMWCGRAFRR